MSDEEFWKKFWAEHPLAIAGEDIPPNSWIVIDDNGMAWKTDAPNQEEAG